MDRLVVESEACGFTSFSCKSRTLVELLPSRAKSEIFGGSSCSILSFGVTLSYETSVVVLVVVLTVVLDAAVVVDTCSWLFVPLKLKNEDRSFRKSKGAIRVPLKGYMALYIFSIQYHPDILCHIMKTVFQVYL